MGEFDLIRRHFARAAAAPANDAVVLGVGDDCALLRVAGSAQGMELAVSSDMLVEGRHFLSTVNPARLGHKALAVNLSDLAACGARPVAYTLALALPRADEVFVEGFARGLHALADAHGIALAGGDTTAGPLNVCITVFGEVPRGQALLRSGAQAGDEVWVSGRLGDARLALEVFRGRVSLAGEDFETVRRAMELPTPRVALGMALRGIATSAIDLSDGLAGDLRHVLESSGVAAWIDADALPRSSILARLPTSLQHECLLAGGDDYELLFTAPPARADAVRAAARAAGVDVTRIGSIEAAARDTAMALRVRNGSGREITADVAAHLRGFDHFV